jgi:hypothetical protein
LYFDGSGYVHWGAKLLIYISISSHIQLLSALDSTLTRCSNTRRDISCVSVAPPVLIIVSLYPQLDRIVTVVFGLLKDHCLLSRTKAHVIVDQSTNLEINADALLVIAASHPRLGSAGTHGHPKSHLFSTSLTSIHLALESWIFPECG